MKRETKEPAVLDGNQWNIAKVAILEFWGPRVKSQRGGNQEFSSAIGNFKNQECRLASGNFRII
jgi:hypothetical protein